MGLNLISFTKESSVAISINVYVLIWDTAVKKFCRPQTRIIYWSGWDWMMKMLTLSTQSAYLLVCHKHNTSHQMHSSWYESSVFYSALHYSSVWLPGLNCQTQNACWFSGMSQHSHMLFVRVMGYQQNTYKKIITKLNSGYLYQKYNSGTCFCNQWECPGTIQRIWTFIHH